MLARLVPFKRGKVDFCAFLEQILDDAELQLLILCFLPWKILYIYMLFFFAP